jgi:hypothetical protein
MPVVPAFGGAAGILAFALATNGRESRSCPAWRGEHNTAVQIGQRNGQPAEIKALAAAA